MKENQGSEKEQLYLRLFAAHSAMFVFNLPNRLSEYVEKMLNTIPDLSVLEVYLLNQNENIKPSKLFGKLNRQMRRFTEEEYNLLNQQMDDALTLYPIKTIYHFYGYIAVQFKNEQVFTNFDAIINNFAISISTILENQQQQLILQNMNNQLENIIEERTKSLQTARNRIENLLGKVVNTLSVTVELRDPYTAGHQYRVAQLAQAIAIKYKFSEEDVHQIYLGGLIHDIGKIQVPSEILIFPGKLSSLQIEFIRTHPEAGKKIIDPIGFDPIITDIVLHHHERLDGSGYPHGLKENEISLATKIVSVADVFEAMSSHRPYRPKKSTSKTLQELVEGSGKRYDPQAVKFCTQLIVEEQFKFL